MFSLQLYINRSIYGGSLFVCTCVFLDLLFVGFLAFVVAIATHREEPIRAVFHSRARQRAVKRKESYRWK